MWNGYESKDFTFCDRLATIVYPKVKPIGKMLLKPEYLNAFPLFDCAMLDKGYYLINIKPKNSWAPEEEIHIMADFVRHCAKELGASERCAVEGLSRGGLQGARLAQLYPELIAVLYLDAPVLNVISIGLAGLGIGKGMFVPGRWECLVEAYGVNESTILNFRNSPIDHMDKLLNNKIPIIMVYGEADEVVIYEEHGKVLESYYKENGGVLEIHSKPGCKHHPHGLENPEPIVNFVEKYFE
ncbi:MAG: alpha/beta hydrolase [Clostridia bacterium]|nr:alpha/beta hydrolase [Clostridia bacterium]